MVVVPPARHPAGASTTSIANWGRPEPSSWLDGHFTVTVFFVTAPFTITPGFWMLGAAVGAGAVGAPLTVDERAKSANASPCVPIFMNPTFEKNRCAPLLPREAPRAILE